MEINDAFRRERQILLNKRLFKWGIEKYPRETHKTHGSG
jgi:hypothetical protein